MNTLAIFIVGLALGAIFADLMPWNFPRDGTGGSDSPSPPIAQPSSGMAGESSRVVSLPQTPDPARCVPSAARGHFHPESRRV